MPGRRPRVLFATAPRFCETVRSHGFQCRPAGLDYLWSEPLVSFPEIADAPRGPEQIRWLVERIGFPRLHLPMAEGVLEISQDFKPDLVVVDFADWGGRLAADVLGIPYVYCSWGYEADMDFSYTGDLYDELRAAFGARPDPVHDTSRGPMAAPLTAARALGARAGARESDDASLCDGAL